MATQNGGYLRYNGPMNSVLVENYGHFTKGESKLVDYLTFCAFNNDDCKKEGWEVSEKEFSSSSGEVKKSEKSEAPRDTAPRSVTTADRK